MDRETKLDIIEISRGYVGAILLAILMFTGVVSSMYAGESMTFKTDLTEPIYWTVVGNTSDMEGLNVSFDNGNITISTVINFASDSFTLVFFNNHTNEIIKEKIIYRSGGSKTKYIDKIVIQNQIVYVPEYINDTKIIEVENIVDKTTILETGYELWHVFLAIVAGGIFIWYVMREKKEEDES